MYIFHNIFDGGRFWPQFPEPSQTWLFRLSDQCVIR